MHLIIIVDSNSDFLEERTIAPMEAPADCDMALQGCSDILALWGLGGGGRCLNPQSGLRIGKNGYTVVNLQVFKLYTETITVEKST